MAKRKPIRASSKAQKIVAVCEGVTINAAKEDGDKKTPPTFNVVAYTGGPMLVGGYDLPIVLDLDGMKFSKSLVANLDHDSSRRVGHVTDKSTEGGKLTLSGVASAATESRREVVESAHDGFQWQASIEAMPDEIEEVAEGESIEVNGQTIEGPVAHVTKSTLLGFAFVSHGADDNTKAKIAADKKAASLKEKKMKLDKKCREWIEAKLPGVDIESLPEDALSNLKADYEGREGVRKPIAAGRVTDTIEAKAIEAGRRKQIKELADEWCDEAMRLERYEDIAAIKAKRDEAIKDETMTVKEFKQELRIATLMQAPPTVQVKATRGLTDKVLEAAICQAGRLKTDVLEDKREGFDDQTLQAAHDRFKGRIGLNEVIIMAAEASGYQGRIGSRVDLELHNAAFGLTSGRTPIQAGGFSTISLPNVFSNVANKFIREAFMAGDQTPMRIAATRPVNDFKQVTTLSLTGDMQFEPLGADGEIKHGQLGEEVYTNQVDLAGRMYAITFKDIRNDDLGALTQTPRRIGRGGILYLNHIFWTEFLNPSVANFWHTNNANVNTAVADMTIGGLTATEVIFMNQTDPDGKPLGVTPQILLVPTGNKALATALMDAQSKLITGASATLSDVNVFAGRFRVESSPYMSNTAYTGSDSAAWYMLADPNELPVIEIAALDGQYQPTVETADAAFNQLGVQMRGWFAIGVKVQEPRGGVRADGGSS